MRALAFVLALAGALSAAPRDAQWCRRRGPANGRAQVAEAPAPPLELAWWMDLWDPNHDQYTSDRILFEDNEQIEEGSPLGLGLAWRADDAYLYAFEIGFYTLGRRVALFDRQSGELLSIGESKDSQPSADKRVASIHDDPGFGGPLVFFGNFFSGTQLLTVVDRTMQRFDREALGISFGGHACEGCRWLTHGLFLDGTGARIVDGPEYKWGHQLRRWGPDGVAEAPLLSDISVPCAVWDDDQLVLFTRGGLSEATNRGTFGWQEYVRIDLRGEAPVVAGRRRVTDFENPTGEMLFEDPPIPPEAEGRMLDRARNAVQAMAISPDGRYVYCHERKASHLQRIVRRRLEDFAVDGALPPDLFPLVSERGFAGQANPELGISFCVDAARVYVHFADRVEAWSPDLTRRLWRASVPPRTLDAHTPFCMDRYLPGNNVVLAARGTETTIATDSRNLYLTTDTTLEVLGCADGARAWSYSFDPRGLPGLERTFRRGDKTVVVRHYGLPGDVILCDDAVYVATHDNQSMLYCFRRAGAGDAVSPKFPARASAR